MAAQSSGGIISNAMAAGQTDPNAATSATAASTNSLNGVGSAQPGGSTITPAPAPS